jgi:DNA-binding MarR family transcriptional regulator
MPDSIKTDHMLGIFRAVMSALVRQDGADLSARQMAILLHCYTNGGPHTVRGLALRLGISKPAVTRALDRLGEFDLIRRKVDMTDRRSVLTQCTAKGNAYLRQLRVLLAEASGAGALPASEPKQLKQA